MNCRECLRTSGRRIYFHIQISQYLSVWNIFNICLSEIFLNMCPSKIWDWSGVEREMDSRYGSRHEACVKPPPPSSRYILSMKMWISTTLLWFSMKQGWYFQIFQIYFFHLEKCSSSVLMFCFFISVFPYFCLCCRLWFWLCPILRLIDGEASFNSAAPIKRSSLHKYSLRCETPMPFIINATLESNCQNILTQMKHL